MRVAVTVEQSWHVVPGGIAISTIELLRALCALPDAPELVGVAAWHRAPPPAAVAPPIPVRHMPLPRRLLYETWQRLRRPVVERSVGPVDVLHDTGYVVPPSRAPLVATVHDLLFLRYPEHYTSHSRWVFRRGLELARRHARLVVCPSEATAAACRDAGFDADRLRVIPWGVRLPTLGSAEVDQILRRYAISRPFVLFCGTIEPRKNLGRILEAFRRVDRDDVDLVLAGPRGWREDIGDGIAALGRRVRTLGFVEPLELHALYEGASAVVYASLAEGFGLPVLEAMAHGVPVVTSAGTATEEVAGDAALLVDPFDTDAIAGALERVLEDGALAASLREAARARAAVFTWERTAELVAGVYAEAVRAGR